MNKYLEKVASTRLIREIIKNPSMFTAKQIKKLTNLGSIRPVKAYYEGLAKGNLSIAKRHNTLIQEPTDKESFAKTLFSGGHRFDTTVFGKPNGDLYSSGTITHLDPNPLTRILSPLHKLFSSKDRSNLVHSFANRHEAHEVSEMSTDFVNRVRHSVIKGTSIPSLNGLISKNGKTVGEHANIAVLMRESNEFSKIPHKNLLDKIEKMRHSTGESDLLKKLTNKPYGSRFNSRDLKTARGTIPTIDVGGKMHHGT